MPLVLNLQQLHLTQNEKSNGPSETELGEEDMAYS
jgi:hypothetical protein